MSLRKIIVENYELSRGRKNVNIEIPKLCILEEKESIEKDISSILLDTLSEVSNTMRGYPWNVRRDPKIIDPDEIATVIIQTEKYTLTKIRSYEEILVNQLVNNDTGKRAEFDEQNQFMKSLENVIVLDQLRFPAPCYECTPLFNSVIPQMFQEVTEVYPDGAARIKGENKTVVFPLNTMGGGYNQVINLLYAIWKAREDEPCTVYLNFWWNHLHPIIRSVFWTDILSKIKEKDIKGTLIIDKYEIEP